jgi:hypothetical protein
MKKFFYSFLTLTVLALCAADINAQENQYTVEAIVDILNEDFEKYPWAHIYYSRKIQDQGGPLTKFVRSAYENGEIVTAEIRKGGWRYEIKLNFITAKQVYAKRSHDIKLALYSTISDLLPQTEQTDGS